jgi:hypothetical protein
MANAMTRPPLQIMSKYEYEVALHLIALSLSLAVAAYSICGI